MTDRPTPFPRATAGAAALALVLLGLIVAGLLVGVALRIWQWAL